MEKINKGKASSSQSVDLTRMRAQSSDNPIQNEVLENQLKNVKIKMHQLLQLNTAADIQRSSYMKKREDEIGRETQKISISQAQELDNFTIHLYAPINKEYSDHIHEVLDILKQQNKQKLAQFLEDKYNQVIKNTKQRSEQFAHNTKKSPRASSALATFAVYKNSNLEHFTHELLRTI